MAPSRVGAWLATLSGALLLSSQLLGVSGIGQETCVSFHSSRSTFSVVSNGQAAPIIFSSDDWPGVQRAAADFADDIQRVTSIKPRLTNVTASDITSNGGGGRTAIIVGTLGKSSLIDDIVNHTKLDVSSVRGNWEAFVSKQVKNPLPGIDSAYVIIGADKRGTIYALYDHSEQFGVSPWYWWADVPTTKQSELYVETSGCSHGSPSVKYRGIFLNDEQPALQGWAMEKFTNGTGSPGMNSPFNSKFYAKLFELLLRIKANYLWPAMWGSAFGVDDPQNQFVADLYGIVMGTSHQEPMMRSTPNEFSLEGLGKWDYVSNGDVIRKYWLEGAKRAKSYESLYTLGMRGFGDLPLSEETNVALLEQVIADQTVILKTAYGNNTDVADIPQLWTLYKEVEGYYDGGLRVPDYVTLLWADDNWGNIRRFPLPAERNRTGGAGVYYHFDYVGDPRNYKWVTSTQISKVYEQMSLAADREATRVWIVNVGDLKPYEREIEFFITYGWNTTRWNPDNLVNFINGWAQREFDVSPSDASTITEIVGNLTRFNSRRKPESLNSTTFNLINYREADRVLSAWETLEQASTRIYNKLSGAFKPAYFQLVHHPVIASANVGRVYISAGLNNLRASQARLSTNDLADKVEELFEKDYDIEVQYNTLLDGKWNHMMDQTHIGYYYWQQPMTNSMPPVIRVHKRKQALAGVMRIVPEGNPGAWPGDNPNQCSQGYNCPPPTITLDNFAAFSEKFFEVSAGGPKAFTFSASANESWVSLTPSSGSISARAPEARVGVSVKNWGQLGEGTHAAVITFTAKAAGEPDLKVSANFVATKNSVPPGFKGFVEGEGVIAIEAAHTSRRTSASGVEWKTLPDYGRTLSGVTPWPRLANSESAFAPGSGPALEYDFYNFNTAGGNLTVITHVSPSLNANGASRPLKFAVSIDGGAPQEARFIPAATPGNLPPQWGGPDGFVANSIVPVALTFTGLERGSHTLKVWAVEPAVVVQRIHINAGGLKPSYLGPPESIRV